MVFVEEIWRLVGIKGDRNRKGDLSIAFSLINIEVVITPTQLSKVVLKKYHSKRGLHPLPY